jgi:CRP/FNR family transcriptional regulator, cyclic AMP receptor protein
VPARAVIVARWYNVRVAVELPVVWDDGPVVRWERLLDLDLDLAEALGDVAVRARDRIGVPTIRLDRGPWHLDALRPVSRRAFAIMVCDGLIVRELDLAETATADLLGPGDLIALGHPADNLLAMGESWHVGARATVAILDERLLPAMHAWPALSARFVARATRQAARAAEQRAISQLPRVELRLRALMWHLAERWGRIASTGVVVPIEVTHGALGRLVGARRPTVSLALAELAREGAMVRRDDGSWLLRADSNPSAPERTIVSPPLDIAAVAPLQASHHQPAAVPRPDGAVLAQRSERARQASAKHRLRSEAVLERSRLTRERAARIRAERRAARRPA